MKSRILVTPFVVVLTAWMTDSPILAATYYVAPAGNDAFSVAQAQNIGTPWQTINRAASNLVAGDTCLVRAGTYRETVTVRASGTAAAPIRFQAYSNETVTVDGTDIITGWTTPGSNLWTAPMGWTLGDGDQVFINGAMKPAARWPDAGNSFPWQNSSIKPSPDWSYVVAAGYTSNTNGWFTDTALPARADGYWNGATVHILSGNGWIMNHPTVVGYTNTAKKIVTNDGNGANSAYAFKAGNEYYLTGKKGELDSEGEWFYESGVISLYATNAPAGVTAKRRNYGFDLRSRAFVKLVNLDFFACTIQTDAGSTDGTFDGLVMQHTGWSSKNASVFGLALRDRCVLRNSELAWDSRGLLQLSGSDIRAINNTLHDSGYVPTWDAMTSGSGYRNLFSHNTLQHSGRGLMGSMGRAAIIQYNELSDAMRLTSDGAAFYTYFEAGNTIFRYNLIHDSPGPKGHSDLALQDSTWTAKTAAGLFITISSGTFPARRSTLIAGTTSTRSSTTPAGAPADPLARPFLPTGKRALMFSTICSTPARLAAPGVMPMCVSTSIRTLCSSLRLTATSGSRPVRPRLTREHPFRV